MAADIRRSLKKFLPHLLQAKNDNLNEADTVMRIIKVFEDVLEYSAMSEITRESNIKDKDVDLAIKLEGTIRILVEVKSAGTPLRDRHIEQAERYAAEGNHRWVVLTNGTAWNLYHLILDALQWDLRHFGCVSGVPQYVSAKTATPPGTGR